VTYGGIGTTRYPEFFADKDLRPEDFTRSSTPLDQHVPSSQRPETPRLMYIVPQFKWERGPNGTRRSGGGLRIYLDRPWYSSGDDEKLAVLLPPGNSFDSRLEPFVSLWGKDPIWSTGPARNSELWLGDFPLAVAALAGDKAPPVLSLSKS